MKWYVWGAIGLVILITVVVIVKKSSKSQSPLALNPASGSGFNPYQLTPIV